MNPVLYRKPIPLKIPVNLYATIKYYGELAPLNATIIGKIQKTDTSWNLTELIRPTPKNIKARIWGEQEPDPLEPPEQIPDTSVEPLRLPCQFVIYCMGEYGIRTVDSLDDRYVEYFFLTLNQYGRKRLSYFNYDLGLVIRDYPWEIDLTEVASLSREEVEQICIDTFPIPPIPEPIIPPQPDPEPDPPPFPPPPPPEEGGDEEGGDTENPGGENPPGGNEGDSGSGETPPSGETGGGNESGGTGNEGGESGTNPPPTTEGGGEEENPTPPTPPTPPITGEEDNGTSENVPPLGG